MPSRNGTRIQLSLSTGSVELKFLAVSTKLSPDLCDYPDAAKFAIMAEMTPEDGKRPACSHLSGAKAKAVLITGKANKSGEMLFTSVIPTNAYCCPVKEMSNCC